MKFFQKLILLQQYNFNGIHQSNIKISFEIRVFNEVFDLNDFNEVSFNQLNEIL